MNSLNHFGSKLISFAVIENAVREEMIPKRPNSGCPSGTFDGLDTCFCEDHCSWSICRLTNPPENCLSRGHGKKIWAWDNIKESWVAQGRK